MQATHADESAESMETLNVHITDFNPDLYISNCTECLCSFINLKEMLFCTM